jgi:hypothetical protein
LAPSAKADLGVTDAIAFFPNGFFAAGFRDLPGLEDSNCFEGVVCDGLKIAFPDFLFRFVADLLGVARRVLEGGVFGDIVD